MFYYTRSKLLFYYRLFFIALFLVLGISGIGIVVVEYFAGIRVITTENYAYANALYATSGFMGILGLVTATAMIYLMREKRSDSADRRQIDRPLDFPDRRTAIERRTVQKEQLIEEASLRDI